LPILVGMLVPFADLTNSILFFQTGI